MLANEKHGTTLLSWLVPYKLDNVNDRGAPLVVVFDDFGLYGPSVVFWMEVMGIVLLQSFLAAMIAVFLSSPHIVSSRAKRWTKYIVGYGVVIPLWLLLPRYQLQSLDIRNMVMNFCLSGIIPTLQIFHTMEAMYGTAPSYTLQSKQNWMTYCASPMMLVWEAKSQKYISATFSLIMRHLRNFIAFSILLGLLHSLLRPYNYQPFTDATGYEWYEPRRIMILGQLGNNACHALLFQMYLVTFSEGLLAVTILLTGYRAETVMENPMLTAVSVSEFWGKKWNKLVHGVLKRGVYLPCRHNAKLPRPVAVFMTFLASSLFHEWLLTSLFYNVTDDNFLPTYGGSTAFLLWNGVLLTLESLCFDWSIFQWIKWNAPRPIRTVLVMLLALPVAHWFCDPFILSNFFRHGEVAFPMLIRQLQK